MDWPKLRSETSTLIVMGNSGWDERCLFLEARLFVVLGESNAWQISSFCGASFQEGFPD